MGNFRQLILFLVFFSALFLLFGCGLNNQTTTTMTTGEVNSSEHLTTALSTTTELSQTSEDELTTTLSEQMTTSSELTSTQNQTTTYDSTELTTAYTRLTVIFNAMGGTTIEQATIEYGGYLSEPLTSREGYLFDGWYTSQNQGSTLDQLWDFSTDVVTENMTLYAKWIALEDLVYHVTFLNTGDSYIEPLTQYIDTLVDAPEAPMMEGYLFDGWYEDDLYITPFDFSTKPSDDIVLYAKWIRDPAMVRVSFETNGGSDIEPIFVEVGHQVKIPKTSLRDEHMFLGWYKDAELTQAAYSPLTVNEDIVLYAKWYYQPNVVYIFFDSVGGSAVDPYQKRPGQGIGAPEEPTKPGYDFIGWYEDEAYTRRYYFMSMGNETITLYAKWQKVELADDDIYQSIENTLVSWGFICDNHICIYEVATGFDYIFDFNNNEFSYVKQIIEENELGYRYYDSVIVVDENWNISYSYVVEEDFGYAFHTTLLMSGNYLTGEYTVDLYDSNIQTQEAREAAAMTSIEHFIDFIESVLEASNLLIDDLSS